MELTDKEKQVTDWYNQNAVAWASQRKKLSEPSFWNQEYEEFKLLKQAQGSVLEIGSGSGREAIEWIRMGYEYYGIDSSKNLIKIAQKTAPDGRYYHTSVYEMPFSSHTFDAFSSWALLPHVPKEKISLALQTIHTVLKRDALGFVAMREGREEQQEPETGRWFSYYAQNEFEEILKHSGFEIVQKGRKESRVNLAWLFFYVRPR